MQLGAAVWAAAQQADAAARSTIRPRGAKVGGRRGILAGRGLSKQGGQGGGAVCAASLAGLGDGAPGLPRRKCGRRRGTPWAQRSAGTGTARAGVTALRPFRRMCVPVCQKAGRAMPRTRHRRSATRARTADARSQLHGLPGACMCLLMRVQDWAGTVVQQVLGVIRRFAYVESVCARSVRGE